MKSCLFTSITAICLASSLAVYADPSPKDYSDVEKKHATLEAKKDPKTGFVVGGKNATALIKRLTEINGIAIAELETSMRPKGLSKA